MSVLESVSERKAGRLAEFGVESVLDLVTTYPRRYIDRTRQADVSGLQVGDEAAVLASVQSARSRRARTGACGRGLAVRDDTGRLADRLLQPALAGQAARGGHRGDLLRQGRRVPGRAPDGQPGGRRRGRGDAGPADAADPARLPGLGQGRADLVGDRGVRGGGAGAGGRVRRPVAARVAVVARVVGADRGVQGHPRPRVARGGRAGPAPARVRRAPPPAARAGAAPSRLRGQRPGAAPRRVASGGHGCGGGHAGGALPGRPALRPHESAAARPGGDRG